MHRFHPTCPQHWPDFGSTSTSKATSAQLGSKIAQLGPNLDPFGSNITSAQIEVHMASTWGAELAQPEIRKCPLFSTFFVLSMTLRLKQCSPCLSPTWCEAIAKGAKLRHIRTELDFHSMWSPSGSLWVHSAQHDELAPTWAPVGPKAAQLGPSWAPFGQPGAKLGPTGPIFAYSTRHGDACHCYFHPFLALMTIRAKPCCPGLSWAQLRRQMPPAGPRCAC